MIVTINNWAQELDKRLGRLGATGAALVMTLFAVTAAVSVHLVLRYMEGIPVQGLPLFNIAVETIAVGMPIILYSRGVIAELARSRTELKEMARRLAISVDAAEQASRAKSAFLANMSHELRTPLNAILGFSEIMKDQHLGPVHNARYLSYAADIHFSGRHLLGIINDVLDLAKIEAGKMSLDSAEEFALAPSVSNALAMVTGLGEKYGVRVTAALDENIRVFAVERMIRQIVINLVGNSIKFTPEGGLVHLAGALQTDGSYELVVHDTGVGMSEKELANALTPFGQNETKLAVKQEGTGLGLPLAKAMLELHGGSLAIASEPFRGTTVTLRLPAERLAVRGRAAA